MDAGLTILGISEAIELVEAPSPDGRGGGGGAFLVTDPLRLGELVLVRGGGGGGGAREPGREGRGGGRIELTVWGLGGGGGGLNVDAGRGGGLRGAWPVDDVLTRELLGEDCVGARFEGGGGCWASCATIAASDLVGRRELWPGITLGVNGAVVVE